MFTKERSGSHWYAGHDQKIIFDKIKYLENLKEEEWIKFKILHHLKLNLIKKIKF